VVSILTREKIQNTSHSSFLFSTLFKLHQIEENSSKEQKNLSIPSKEKYRGVTGKFDTMKIIVQLS
jgi:hypothetical protein